MSTVLGGGVLKSRWCHFALPRCPVQWRMQHGVLTAVRSPLQCGVYTWRACPHDYPPESEKLTLVLRADYAGTVKLDAGRCQPVGSVVASRLLEAREAGWPQQVEIDLTPFRDLLCISSESGGELN